MIALSCEMVVVPAVYWHKSPLSIEDGLRLSSRCQEAAEEEGGGGGHRGENTGLSQYNSTVRFIVKEAH